jgi:hypothetical protein
MSYFLFFDRPARPYVDRALHWLYFRCRVYALFFVLIFVAWIAAERVGYGLGRYIDCFMEGNRCAEATNPAVLLLTGGVGVLCAVLAGRLLPAVRGSGASRLRSISAFIGEILLQGGMLLFYFGGLFLG